MHDLANNSRTAKTKSNCYTAEVIVPLTVYHAWKYARYDVVFNIILISPR